MAFEMKVIGGKVKVLSDSKMRVVVNPEQVLSPNYSLWVDSLTANETNANTVIFYLSADNVLQSNFPTTVPFQLIGQTTQNDFIVGTELSGAFVLYDNNWTSSKSFEILADSLTDGDKTMTLILTSVGGLSCPSEAQSLTADVLIYDTSLFPPGYTLSIEPTESNVTNGFIVNLTTTGVANGTKIPFVLSGNNITVQDFTGVSTLSGLFEVTGASEPVDITPVVTTQTFTVTADNLTEGTETFGIVLSSAGGTSCPNEAQGITKYITIYDTLTVSASTVLLLNGNGDDGANNNPFADGSSNNFVITARGNTTQSTLTPFVSGESVYFDGSGDYLTVPSSSSHALQTNDFTIEFWVNTTNTDRSSGAQRRIVGKTSNAATGFQIVVATAGNIHSQPSGAIYLFTTDGTAVMGTTVTSVADGAWHHVAFCRSENQLRTYLDGALTDVRANTTNFSSTALLSIGARQANSDGYFNGYLSNLRIVNGTALYTSNFSVPTYSLENIANTSLLLKVNQPSVVDSSNHNYTINTLGNSQIKTDQSKFGGSSLYFDGNGDYLEIKPAGTNFNFGVGQFTVEFWINTLAVNTYLYPKTIIDTRPVGTNGNYWHVSLNKGKISAVFGNNTANSLTTNVSLIAGQWHHIAMSRQASGLASIFLDGQLQQQKPLATAVAGADSNRIWIGTNAFRANLSIGTLDFNGYLDDLRIVKGVALYTSNFTPPTQQLTINV